jgi:sn-glycerol 3-phosphate transport system permease protein
MPGKTLLPKRLFPLLLLLPSLIFLFLFTYLPFGVAALESLYEFRGLELGRESFAGLDNYRRLFADPAFSAACANNALLVLLTAAPGIALALGLALLVKRSTLLNRLLRALFFFPTIVPLVAASALWIFIFLPGLGLIDYYLTRYFNMAAHNFLGDEQTALLALVVLTIWKFAGYYMVFFLAALQGIPDDSLEAAALEGAGAWQSFRLVTLPMLRPVITFVGTIAVIYAVTQVDHVLMMTNGGPNNSTSVLLFYIFTTAQEGYDLGKASAATVLTLAVLLLITLVNMHILERGAHYEQ